ncbi:hypothetical protein HYV86_03495 [Candidatus Woesearchaeota archaeon]|nr:hypothetical protein [Candidatus Woesearchaeota archaeon]
MNTNRCPDCMMPLHTGQHKFADGMYEVQYCKECGFRKEIGLKHEQN